LQFYQQVFETLISYGKYSDYFYKDMIYYFVYFMQETLNKSVNT